MNETTSETIPLTRYTHPNASISDSLGPNEHTAIRREEEAEEAEALLAKDDSETEEEDWTVEVDENTIRALHPTCWDLPIFRFSLCGFTVGFLFFAIKLVFMKYTHSTEHHHRVPERMFYNGTESFGSTVIMISLDGFRSEYLSREITPNLQRIGK
ncbi:hypothetical protein BDF14DRAFT_1055954 [Spinellus fusiger]|nr:hypothetical protein BDF14DRAFT_1055954 [Spinellus fusiger]